MYIQTFHLLYVLRHRLQQVVLKLKHMRRTTQWCQVSSKNIHVPGRPTERIIVKKAHKRGTPRKTHETTWHRGFGTVQCIEMEMVYLKTKIRWKQFEGWNHVAYWWILLIYLFLKLMIVTSNLYVFFWRDQTLYNPIGFLYTTSPYYY